MSEKLDELAAMIENARAMPMSASCILNRTEVLEAIDLDSVQARGYAFQVEMTYRAIRAGFRVAEVPIVFRERRVGSSKMDGSIVAEAIWQVPRLRFGSERVAEAPHGTEPGRYTF